MLILYSHINTASYSSATHDILRWTSQRESRYVCIANVHVVMEAYDAQAFQSAVNQADLVTPDGMPLVWMMRLKGERDQQRVYGPILMLHVLEAAAKENVPVGFYGGTPEVLSLLVEQMKARYQDLIVSYAWNPPFSDIDQNTDEEIVTEINQSGARILFVGLGCPKQEIWMSKHQGRVQAVMLGVGAAFDFHSGVKRQAPPWMQNTGLEWLFRLLTEPQRLWKRYLYHNPRFLFLAAADLLGFLKRSG